MIKPKRGELYWVDLDPTVGSEITKKRPAVIISNDIGNMVSPRVIVAPITSKASKIFPFEVPISLKTLSGKILLDQLRSVDKIRLAGKIDSCDSNTMDLIAEALKITLALP